MSAHCQHDTMCQYKYIMNWFIFAYHMVFNVAHWSSWEDNLHTLSLLGNFEDLIFNILCSILCKFWHFMKSHDFHWSHLGMIVVFKRNIVSILIAKCHVLHSCSIRWPLCNLGINLITLSNILMPRY